MHLHMQKHNKTHVKAELELVTKVNNNLDNFITKFYSQSTIKVITFMKIIQTNFPPTQT